MTDPTDGGDAASSGAGRAVEAPRAGGAPGTAATSPRPAGEDAAAQPILAAVAALAPAAPEAVLPGAHRGGFTRAPTAPIGITEQQPDIVPVTGNVVTPPPAVRPANLGGIGLGFAIVGLIASFVVGVAFPLGVTAVVLAILSLRRSFESTTIAVWAIVLGAMSVLYSAGWLMWAAYRAGLLG